MAKKEFSRPHEHRVNIDRVILNKSNDTHGSHTGKSNGFYFQNHAVPPYLLRNTRTNIADKSIS